MNPDQLWDTTMDPASRTLMQVTIEDGVGADETFDMLMGAPFRRARSSSRRMRRKSSNLDI